MTRRPVEVLPRLAVTVREASEMTGISADVLYKHIESGNLAAGKPSRSWVIVLSDLHQWLEDLKTAARKP